jgi:hypothetical protein
MMAICLAVIFFGGLAAGALLVNWIGLGRAMAPVVTYCLHGASPSDQSDL